MPLLQLGVLGFGFFQGGEISVGIFPEREEILVGGAALLAIALQSIGAAKSQVRERHQRIGGSIVMERENFLEFVYRFGSITVSFVQGSSSVTASTNLTVTP